MKSHVIVKQNIHPTYSVFSEYAVYGKEEAKEILHIEKGKSVLLFFGLIRPYKGLEYLIYAMLEIVKHKKDCMLLIVGEFYEPKEKYITLINSLEIDENVMVIDQYINNEDVPLYFCCADVIVLPYVEASQSGIIQIAFGLGKPVITTNAGGLPEVVEDGKTGFIVEKKSSQRLAEAVIKYYAEQCESPFRQEIKNRSHTFSWHTELQIIESFFAE
jgi:glycosyltransferase involved in cell wall biosynthesis